MRKTRRYSIACSTLEKEKGIITNDEREITIQISKGILQIEIEENDEPEIMSFEYQHKNED